LPPWFATAAHRALALRAWLLLPPRLLIVELFDV